MTPTWMHNEIRDGLSKLLCLRLDNCPADDMIDGTAQAWGVALTVGKAWDEHRDRWRIREGFDHLLASGITRWPQPQRLLDCLPEPRELRLAGSTRPNPDDPYERQHRARMAEYQRAGKDQAAGPDA